MSTSNPRCGDEWVLIPTSFPRPAKRAKGRPRKVAPPVPTIADNGKSSIITNGDPRKTEDQPVQPETTPPAPEPLPVPGGKTRAVRTPRAPKGLPVVAAKVHATRQRAAKQPVRQTLTREALKDHEQLNPRTSMGMRKRKAPAASIASTNRLTRSQAKFLGKSVLWEAPLEPSAAAIGQQTAPTAKPPLPSATRTVVLKYGGGTQVLNARSSGEAVQQFTTAIPAARLPAKKDGRRVIHVD